MISRQERLHEAFEYLRNNCGIHTQTDFANAIKYSRVYVSSALNGNENNLTDDEISGVKKVLTAAALTYIAALLVFKMTHKKPEPPKKNSKKKKK